MITEYTRDYILAWATNEAKETGIRQWVWYHASLGWTFCPVDYRLAMVLKKEVA